MKPAAGPKIRTPIVIAASGFIQQIYTFYGVKEKKNHEISGYIRGEKK